MNNKPVIVLGAGGHAKVLVDILLQQNRFIEAITDNDKKKFGSEILGVKVEGNDLIVNNYNPNDIELVNGIGSIGGNLLRKKIYDNFVQKGYKFANVIHPSAIISDNVIIGKGVQILAGAVISVDTCIGNNVIINTRASIDHECMINDNVHIAPGCTLSGGIVVGKDTHLGTGCTVIQGINIGEGAIIAAGAVVVSNIPSMTKCMGVPARVVK